MDSSCSAELGRMEEVNGLDDELCKEPKRLMTVDFSIRCCLDGKLVRELIGLAVTFSSSGELNCGNTAFPGCCHDAKEADGLSFCLEA